MFDLFVIVPPKGHSFLPLLHIVWISPQQYVVNQKRSTIHQLLDHAQQVSFEGNHEFTLDGVPIGPVSIVGVVQDIKVQKTNTLFILNDGYGWIEAREWREDGVSEEEDREHLEREGIE